MIPNQQKMWNGKHADRPRSEWHDNPSDFTSEVINFLKQGDYLLELGCGVGVDARFFAQNNIQTLATDFSNVVIEKNKTQTDSENLAYSVLDVSSKFPYKNASFDGVYAHLSLHYFSDKDTRGIFKEIYRILKPGALLAFRCKSTNDRTYGQGDKIGPDVFLWKSHIRHLFTVEYAKKLLGKEFSILQLEETKGTYAGVTSHFIDCVARKS